jgi:DNA-binding transcriptional LysR family regulator
MVNLAAENQNEIIGTFSLSVNQNPGDLKIAALLDNLTENCPGISLEINNLATGRAIEAIRQGRVDGGYIYGDVPEDFVALNVKQQQITTIAPLEYQVNADDLTHTLAQQPWITMGHYCPFDCLLHDKLGNNLPSIAKTSDDGTRLELVRSGQGLSFLEAENAAFHAQRQEIKLLPQLDFSTALYFVSAKQRQSEPVIKAMLQEIRVLWQLAL